MAVKHSLAQIVLSTSHAESHKLWPTPVVQEYVMRPEALAHNVLECSIDLQHSGTKSP
jgi:hypothetical protein